MKTYFAAFLFVLATATMCGGIAQAQYPGMPRYPGPGPSPYVMAPMAFPGGGQPAMVLQPVAVPAQGAGVVQAGYAGGGGCDVSCDTGCDSPCDGSCGGNCPRCCAQIMGFEHCWHFYGEFLYLRARDSEVAWATPANSAYPVGQGVGRFPASVQIGPLGVLDMDYQPGFRAGFQYNLSECAGISAQFTMYEATTTDVVAITGPNVIHSLVSHPSLDTTARFFRQGDANYGISFDMVDVDFHQLLAYDYDYQFGYLLGVGAVQMEQGMTAIFQGAPGLGSETVITDIDFTGAGLRFGLEGEYGRGGRFRAYGKGIGSLMAGEFRADYDLGHSFDADVINTSWHGGRIVGIWNLELGVKWVSCCGNYSANVGYLYSAWTNTVQTDQWIHGVQTNNYANLDDTMTFDGLVARFEARF